MTMIFLHLIPREDKAMETNLLKVCILRHVNIQQKPQLIIFSDRIIPGKTRSTDPFS